MVSWLKPCFQVLAWQLESHPSSHIWSKVFRWISFQFTSCPLLTGITSAGMLVSRLERSFDGQQTNMAFLKCSVQRASCQTLLWCWNWLFAWLCPHHYSGVLHQKNKLIWYKNQGFLSLHRFDSSVLFLIRDTARDRYAILLKTSSPRAFSWSFSLLFYSRDPFLLEEQLSTLQDKSISMYYVRS